MAAEIDSSLRAFLKAQIEEYWQKSQKPLLLAALGSTVRARFPEASVLMPDGLRRYLEETDIARIVHDPVVAERVGAIPIGAQSEAPHAVASAQTMVPKLAPDLWRAFFTPIASRRFVLLNDAGKFAGLLDASESPQARHIEITHTDVDFAPTEFSGDRIAQNWARIRRWAETHGINVADLSVQTQAADSTDLSRKLARGLSQLDDADLARISIPFDLVMKMLRRGAK